MWDVWWKFDEDVDDDDDDAGEWWLNEACLVMADRPGMLQGKQGTRAAN